MSSTQAYTPVSTGYIPVQSGPMPPMVSTYPVQNGFSVQQNPQYAFTHVPHSQTSQGYPQGAYTSQQTYHQVPTSQISQQTYHQVPTNQIVYHAQPSIHNVYPSYSSYQPVVTQPIVHSTVTKSAYSDPNSQSVPKWAPIKTTVIPTCDSDSSYTDSYSDMSSGY
ncbi:unnamed protein product [Mytilus coruscus]|uniref:Uncharacterized protein n=1 Tax=Mytilus coruscus TaxID=42192 RepID=A0A6J8EKE8_MYTCO|nr:unnamed protein product [Mytilus coruscus]